MITIIALFLVFQVEKFLMKMLEECESALGEPGLKTMHRIEKFPAELHSIACSLVVNDTAYNNLIEFPSPENRMRKNIKDIFSQLSEKQSFLLVLEHLDF